MSELDKIQRELFVGIKEKGNPNEILNKLNEFKKNSLIMLPNTFIGIGINFEHKAQIQYQFEECLIKYDVKDVIKFLKSFPLKIKTIIESNIFTEFFKGYYVPTKVFTNIWGKLN